MNILFTTTCNLSCPYCFARNGNVFSLHNDRRENLSFENLNFIIDFLKKSGENHFRIIGGEPTLHPEFINMVKKILKEKFQIIIFTNGKIKKNIVEFFKKIEDKRLEILLNINFPEFYSESEWDTIIETMSELNRKTHLGFNFYKSGLNTDFLTELTKKYNLKKKIRVSFAHPIVGSENQFLPMEERRKTILEIISFARKCDMFDISLKFDCGFTLCDFSEKEIGALYSYNSLLETYCTPSLDVSPNLDVWYCFVTSKVWSVKLTDFENLTQLYDYFSNKTAPFHKVGMREVCSDCKYLRRGQCSGGCLGHILRSFHIRNI